MEAEWSNPTLMQVLDASTVFESNDAVVEPSRMLYMLIDPSAYGSHTVFKYNFSQLCELWNAHLERTHNTL
jgi:hypothetical protein